MEELDKAVLDILSETDSASLTIPEFKDILMKKLEADLWPDGIYISDDDDEQTNIISTDLYCLIINFN